MKKISIFKNVLSLLAIISMLFPVAVAAIGMASDKIIINDALRGSQYRENISIINNSLTNDDVFALTADGDIKDWITYYEKDSDVRIEKIAIPAKSKKTIQALISIPASKPNGTYTGKIIATSGAVDYKEETSGSSVNLRVARDVSVTVTDKESIQTNTIILPNSYTIEKNSSVKFKVIYENNGNVQVAPELEIKISKAGKTVFNAIYPYPDQVLMVAPSAKKEFESLVEWSTAGQELGAYLVETKTKINDKLVQEQKIDFTVVEKINDGVAMVAGAADVAGGGGINQVMMWYILGAVVVLAVALATIKFFRKSKNQTLDSGINN